MIMYENGITVGILRQHLEMFPQRQIIIYYEYLTPDDPDYATDTDIHTVTGIAYNGNTVKILSKRENGKRVRMVTEELTARLSDLSDTTPVKLGNGEQITGICLGTDDAGYFCFALENNVMY